VKENIIFAREPSSLFFAFIFCGISVVSSFKKLISRQNCTFNYTTLWPNNQNQKKGFFMKLFFRAIIATLALAHLAPTHAMSRTYTRKQERPCIEPLIKYAEKEGTPPLAKSDLVTSYLRCYDSRTKSQKKQELIRQDGPSSYILPKAPIKHSSGTAMNMLHCEKEPHKPARCLLEAAGPHRSSLLEVANPAFFDLLAMAHALQTRTTKRQ
jgi:hypothetical protein